MNWRTKISAIRERFRKKTSYIAPSEMEKSKFHEIEILMSAGKYQKALSRLRDSESTIQQTLDKLSADLLKGKCLLHIGEFKTALMVTRQIIEDSKSIPGTELIALDANILLASGLSETGNLQESFKICEYVESLLETIFKKQPLETAKRKASIFHIKGYISWLWGQDTEALAHFNQSLSLRETTGQEKGIALELARLGIVQARIDPEKAKLTIKRGLKIMKALEKEEYVDLLLLGLSKAHMKLGDLQQSIQYLEEGLIVADRIDNKRNQTNLFLGLGILLQAMGKFAESIEYYNKALELGRLRGEKKHVASSLGNLGEIARQRGELKKAQKYYNEAIDLFIDIGYRRGVALTLLNNGSVTHHRGESEEAIKLFQNSLAIGEELESLDIMAYSLYYLVCVEVDIEMISDAQEHLLKLKQIAEEGKGKMEFQLYRIGEALILKKSKRARKRTIAEELLKQVVSEDVLLDEMTTFALLNLCDFLADELRISGEEEVLIELKEYVERLVSLSHKQKSPLLLAEAYWLQSQLALIEFDSEEALRLLDQAQDIAEKQGLERLAIKISTEYDKLLINLDEWKKLASDKAPINKRVEAAKFENLISNIVSKREIETIELEEEEPIQFLLVAANAGFNLYTKTFEGEVTVDESLVSGFLTALSSFSKEVFAQTLERVKVGEYVMFMKIEQPFLFCYIFKGPSYKAMQKMSRFVEAFRDESSLWTQMEQTVKTGQINRPAMADVDKVVERIFIKA